LKTQEAGLSIVECFFVVMRDVVFATLICAYGNALLWERGILLDVPNLKNPVIEIMNKSKEWELKDINGVIEDIKDKGYTIISEKYFENLEKLNQCEPFYSSVLSLNHKHHIDELIEQAKKMEKEQLLDMGNQFAIMGEDSPEQYFNEKYKNK